MEIYKENKNKKGLGRGIGSLLQGSESAASDTSQIEKSQQALNTQVQQQNTIQNTVSDDKRIWQIAIDKLVPGQYQPRKKFDKESLQELAKSIKENGILQPITVRKRTAGGYEIIAGERRWRAAQLAELHEVPAIIKQISDQDALQLALIENIQREDLDAIEEAESYQRLIEEFSLSQQQVAEKVGKERSTVANSLRLLALPFEIKNFIGDKKLTTGHAKVLLSLDNKQDQMAHAKEVIEKGLSVRALEQKIKDKTAAVLSKSTLITKADIKTENLSSKLAEQLADQIQKSVGTKANIKYKNGKGEIVLSFYSDEQLNAIYEKLVN